MAKSRTAGRYLPRVHKSETKALSNRDAIVASAWGFGTAVFLRYGLEPLGWLFYEASHATGIDWLYWGYSAFRGGGYAFGLWPYQTVACLGAGVLVSFFIMYLRRKRSIHE